MHDFSSIEQDRDAWEGKLVPLTTLYDGGFTPDPSFHVNQPYDISAYRVEEDKTTIADAVWGTEEIGHEPGDEVFRELVTHHTLARLLGIEQLTLPRFMTTIAGTSGLSRWEHVWGSLIVARRAARPLGLSPIEQRKLELRAFLSDWPQWAGSHLGDWMLQGMGGPEDAHDDRQAKLLEITGVNEILERHGYDPAELLVKREGQEQDWLECDPPDINIDKLDYGSREILRWLNHSRRLSARIKDVAQPMVFVDEASNRMVFRNKELALDFTKAFLLLPTEHWQEPVHRLQLVLLSEIIKAALIRQEPLVMRPLIYDGRYHPQDYLMTTDSDFDLSMHTTHPLTWALHDITHQIGRERRLVHNSIRSAELAEFLREDSASEFPDPIISKRWQGEHHSLNPSCVEIVPVESPADVEDFGDNPYSVDFFLPALKPRSIDPLFKDEDGNVKRLSEESAVAARLIEQQKAIMARNYVGRILVNKTYKNHIETGLAENAREWPELLKLPCMTDEIFLECFREAASYAVGMRKNPVQWAI